MFCKKCMCGLLIGQYHSQWNVSLFFKGSPAAPDQGVSFEGHWSPCAMPAQQVESRPTISMDVCSRTTLPFTILFDVPAFRRNSAGQHFWANFCFFAVNAPIYSLSPFWLHKIGMTLASFYLCRGNCTSEKMIKIGENLGKM